MTILRRSKLLIQKAQFLLWKQKNPSATFKDYFLEIVKSDLARGVPHPTLGPSLHSGEFELSGRKTFPGLARRYGIRPDDVCVDYGCGTLRIGIHAMRYLNPGCYWGMDIGEFLLAEGRELVGSNLLKEKMPHLYVISDDTVARAAAARPKLVFSVNVLLHVHPQELAEYFRNILAIAGTTAIGVINGAWGSRTIQVARQSWTHSETDLRKAAQLAGGSLVFIPKGDRDQGLIEVRNQQ